MLEDHKFTISKRNPAHTSRSEPKPHMTIRFSMKDRALKSLSATVHIMHKDSHILDHDIFPQQSHKKQQSVKTSPSLRKTNPLLPPKTTLQATSPPPQSPHTPPAHSPHALHDDTQMRQRSSSLPAKPARSSRG